MTISQLISRNESPTVIPPPYQLNHKGWTLPGRDGYTRTGTDNWPESVRIGMDKYGVDWRCYREPGESFESWDRRAEQMLQAFEERNNG